MISNKRRLAAGISTIAIAGALGLATPAEAQTTSTLQGHATAGSTVTATDVNTGHSDTAKVDASGNYIIVGLAPSTYRVQSGTASQTVVVRLGQAVTVDLTAAAAAAPGGSSIVVVGSRTRDVKTPTVATSVSRFQIENLPNGDRNFLNFAALAPGVTVSSPTLNGKARQVQAGAINSDNTNTFIDGLSIKNLVNHGGTVGQNYWSGNPFPASAVDQFDVQTQNFKAESSRPVRRSFRASPRPAVKNSTARSSANGSPRPSSARITTTAPGITTMPPSRIGPSPTSTTSSSAAISADRSSRTS